MTKWERIIRNNFNHLDKDTLEAIVGMFGVSLQEGYVLSLDKDYILKFCDDFCKYANLPQRVSTKELECKI